jgi:hypothetical protein
MLIGRSRSVTRVCLLVLLGRSNSRVWIGLLMFLGSVYSCY